MNKLFYICGPHCSGKTTIINRLKRDGITVFAGSEIGKDFYYERKKNGFETALVNKEFEYEVANAEISRDIIMSESEGLNVVETWHPGNLAYILERNPKIFGDMVDYIKYHSPYIYKNIPFFGIYLKVSKENIYNRTKTFSDSREWAAEFYTRIGANIEKSTLALDFADKTYIVNANSSLEDTYNQVKTLILKL